MLCPNLNNKYIFIKPTNCIGIKEVVSQMGDTWERVDVVNRKVLKHIVDYVRVCVPREGTLVSSSVRQITD